MTPSQRGSVRRAPDGASGYRKWHLHRRATGALGTRARGARVRRAPRCVPVPGTRRPGGRGCGSGRGTGGRWRPAGSTRRSPAAVGSAGWRC